MKHEVDCGAAGHSLFDLRIADEGHLQRRVGRNLEFVVAVNVGNRSLSGSGHDHGGTDYGLTALIDNLASDSDGNILSLRVCTTQRAGNRHNHQREHIP